jgi:hypothetical protein
MIKDTRPFRKGDKINRGKLNDDIGGRVQEFVPGPGIEFRRSGATVVISTTDKGNARGRRNVTIYAPYSGA